jgi:nitrate reductase gamma subunit
LSEIIRYLDSLLLIGLPYASLTLFVVGLLHRYRVHNANCVSPSTQFIENRNHFWAAVPFHYGVIGVLSIHLISLLLPQLVLFWISSPPRLYALEIASLMLGLLAACGIVVGILRRWNSPTLKKLTGRMDWLVLTLVALQVGSGVFIAVFNPWGTAWFAAAATPYLKSLALLNPETGYLIEAPLAIRLHVANAFLILAIVPYTRLIHIVLVPVGYVWRAPLLYRWLRRPEAR